jgi:UDP-glucose 4-epimerase
MSGSRHNATPRTTLITGGSGFIGQALIKNLLAKSDRNIIAVGRSAVPKFPLPDAVSYHSGDISDMAFIGPLLDKATEVVDLAYGTTPKTSFDDPVQDVILNLPASVTLQRLASERNIKRYLLVSSGGTVYGNSRYLPITEHHPNNPISPYGISKLVTEKYAHFFCQMSGLPVIVARPSNAFGIGQIGKRPQGFIGVAMHAALNNLDVEIFGERGTVRDYIYIDDLAEALVALLEHGAIGETYNIGSGIGYDNLDVLSMLAEVCGAGFAPRTIHRPLRPFDVLANVLNPEKINSATGWAPKYSLRQGLEEICRQLKQSA